MISTTATLIHKYDSPSNHVSLVIFQVEETFTFQEGQFVMIEKEIEGKLIKRPYSIATTNIQLQEQRLLGIVVKKTSENGMSDRLTQTIEEGDTVQIKGPVGHYVDTYEFQSYLFVSAGSGLSPNVGLFQHLVYESKRFDRLVNLFGERYYTHIIPEVENIFIAHGDSRVHNMFFLSQEEFPLLDQVDFLVEDKRSGIDLYRPGRVQAGLTEAIDILGIHTACFVCGQPQMVAEVSEQLQTLGIPKEQITIEKY